jgi:uncharacterized membrane protein YedE/YeeE
MIFRLILAVLLAFFIAMALTSTSLWFAVLCYVVAGMVLLFGIFCWSVGNFYGRTGSRWP